jgi:hypothetical protein
MDTRRLLTVSPLWARDEAPPRPYRCSRRWSQIADLTSPVAAADRLGRNGASGHSAAVPVHKDASVGAASVALHRYSP